MFNFENEVEEKIAINRAQIEHRGTWMALIYDEMVRAGIDAEPIIRRAIKRTGHIHGERILSGEDAPIDCEEFKNKFFGSDDSAVGIQSFNMTNVSSDEKNVYSTFRYCALLKAWQKLGFDDATLVLLCDMAMDGDRGIAETVGLNLKLEDTLAKGCTSCKLHFSK